MPSPRGLLVFHILVVCIVGASLAHADPSHDVKKLLIGTWEEQVTKTTDPDGKPLPAPQAMRTRLEFRGDGTVVASLFGNTSKKWDELAHGTYKWIDTQTIEVDLGAPSRSKIAFDGNDRLTLTGSDGKRSTSHRVK